MDQIIEGVTLLSVNEFDYAALKRIPFQRRKRGNQGTKARQAYKDIITSFDIETTSLPEIRQSFMYVWQWAFGPELVVMGRTWDELKEFVAKLKPLFGKDERLVCYVHNLSFEFQFLSGVFEFGAGDVFAVGSRKVLKCVLDDFIEFRCSYLHSNMSLKRWTERLGVKHGKLSGDDFNYDIIRTSTTPLSDLEIQYCCNDVLGVVEAIAYECEKDGDNLYTIPLTSTGYVRRDAKAALADVNHYWLYSIQPDWHLYNMLREAFRGGNTHANRYYAGCVLNAVRGVDESSAYPTMLITREYPVRPFFEYGPATMEEVTRMLTVRHKALIMRVNIWGLRLKDDGWPCPYLSYDKVRGSVNAALDNGRILEADYLETTITDLDFRIILREYEFDHIEFTDVAHSTYGPLPEAFTDLVKSYYDKKTVLKGKEEDAYFYGKAKEKLNSLYGLMAQDPVKISEVYEDGEWTFSDDDPEELLLKTSRKAFLPYQWGVWCTAWARLALEDAIELAGDDFVYADTDSIKYTGEVDFSEMNKKILERATECGAFATDAKGRRHYMGVFEHDSDYKEFATLGAKKYVYTDEEDKLHITIAGVNKERGAKELEAAGGIHEFKIGFVFRDGGGNEVVYNDVFPESATVGSETIPLTKNVFIGPSEYTLGVTNEYQKLITDPHIIHRIGLDKELIL